MIAATAALIGAVVACSPPDGGSPAAGGSGTPGAEQEAEQLGRQVLRLLDQAASYRGSHRGRLPTSVAQLGTDSLTAETVLRLADRNDSAVAQVAFRRTEGRALAWCEASTEALEQASLNAGEFAVWCARVGGEPDSFTVGGAD